MTPGSSSQPEPQLDEPRRRRDRSTGATIIDLSTRNALPPVSSRPRSERLGMFAGLAVVALLVGLTVWTIRQSQEKPGLPSAQRPEQAANLPGTALPASQPGDWELKIEPPGPLNAASANETPAAALPAPDLSPVLANPLALPDISEGLPPPSTRPSAGPTVVFGSGPEDSGVGFAFEPGAGNEFGGAVKSQRASPTGNGGSKLLAPPGDPARTLGKGTLIPANSRDRDRQQCAGRRARRGERRRADPGRQAIAGPALVPAGRPVQDEAFGGPEQRLCGLDPDRAS